MAAQDPRVQLMIRNYGSAEDAILSILQEKDRLEHEVNELTTVNVAFTNNTNHMFTIINTAERTLAYQRQVISSMQTENGRLRDELKREKRLGEVFRKPSSSPVILRPKPQGAPSQTASR